MTVVIGTTLRPEDAPLAEVAALLAAQLETSVRLVHVCEDPRAQLVLGTDQEHLLGPIREALRRQADELQRDTGATVHPHLVSGSVITALVSLAQFELATILVVGPTTRHFRNTAERVARSSRVPVLVARAPERLTAWLRDGKPLRVLVGADLGRTAEAARQFASLLAKRGPSEIEVAHIASPHETHARLGLAPPVHGLSREAEAALLRELSDTAPPDEGSAALRVVAGLGRADVHLVARAEEGSFDVVVVGQRRRSLVEQIWHGSIARGVLQSAPVTTICVPLPIGDVDKTFRLPRVVVVCADFTETDHRAVNHAIGHAAEGATVHIAHLLGAYDPPSLSRQAREDAHYQLSRLKRKIGTVGRSISIETHVLDGPPLEQLLAFSERVGADLLVLGTQKRTTVERLLTGSLARAVMDEARFPVLVVPARSA